MNNPVLKALIEGGYSLSEFVAFVKFLTDYIQAHPDAIPFNLPNLAVASNIPLDTIRDYFMVLGQTFTLFKQSKILCNLWGIQRNSPRQVFDPARNLRYLKLRNKMQSRRLNWKIYSISAILHVSRKLKESLHRTCLRILTDLQQRFPGFFENKADGWNVSDFADKNVPINSWRIKNSIQFRKKSNLTILLYR